MDGSITASGIGPAQLGEALLLQPSGRGVMITATILGGDLAHLAVTTAAKVGGIHLPLAADEDFATPTIDKVHGIVGPLDNAGNPVEVPLHEAPEGSRIQFRIAPGPHEIRVLAQAAEGDTISLAIEYSY